VTHTPPLGRRVVLAGVAVLVAAVVLVDCLVYLALRYSLNASLEELLDERVRIVQAQSEGVAPQDLAERLQQLGLRAVVTAPDGSSYAAVPPSPRLPGELPPAEETGPQPEVSRTVELDDGTTVRVAARTSGVQAALRRLLLAEAVVSLGAVAAAVLLLRAASARALQPLAVIAEAAARTTRGERGERLRPDQPDTELGRMATSYDAMLDALEQALDDARAAQQASALLAAVVEGSADAVVTSSLDGTVLTWNGAAERMFGYDAGTRWGSTCR
jgi:nitrogen fixation/metabolism regulation signal transduction histidine kinase